MALKFIMFINATALILRVKLIPWIFFNSCRKYSFVSSRDTLKILPVNFS